MRIAVTGNIGAGKTTCMKIIENHFENVVLVNEPLDVWMNFPNPLQANQSINMLDCYYKDTKKYAMPFQVLVQNSFLERCLAQESKPHKVLCTERTLCSSFEIFTKVALQNGHLSDAEYAVLAYHTSIIQKTFPALLRYDAIVYLRCPPERCLERVKRRNRSEEQTAVTVDYLQQLHNAYEKWAESTNGQARFAPLDVKHVIIIDNGQQTLEQTKRELLISFEAMLTSERKAA